mmetsp:Transcript_119005/g.210391  ORF Transcript_119005/g.210391 Transcript_119005/m.210391 type:complete len:206 (-) Transcript_119005:87-704(-)
MPVSTDKVATIINVARQPLIPKARVSDAIQVPKNDESVCPRLVALPSRPNTTPRRSCGTRSATTLWLMGLREASVAPWKQRSRKIVDTEDAHASNAVSTPQAVQLNAKRNLLEYLSASAPQIGAVTDWNKDCASDIFPSPTGDRPRSTSRARNEAGSSCMSAPSIKHTAHRSNCAYLVPALGGGASWQSSPNSRTWSAYFCSVGM